MGSPTKDAIRASVLASRRAVPPEVHEAEAAALCGHLAALVRPDQTVCAYVPIRFEPGTITLLDKLLHLGARVLLPVARHDDYGAAQPMHWGQYQPGRLVAARMGLQEPPQPWLPAGAVADATVVLVPALAVDVAGIRLGRGAGFYDRTLPLARPAARLVAVVRDDEVVDELPAEPHDVPMTHALTPRRAIVELG